MMTKEESEAVKIVYNRLIDSEEENWSHIDDNLELCSYLSDSELIAECSIKYLSHSQGVFRCSQDHPIEFCMAPRFLHAVETILTLYCQTQQLHPKNKYILEYYLTMSEMKMIFSETSGAM